MRGITRMASVAAALAVMAAPVMAQGGPGRGQGPAQGRGMMMGGPAAMARNPVQVVLDHQEELELTADQVETLNGLKARLDEENGPRLEQLRAAFGDADPAELSVEERQAIRERMQELAPVREEIQAANRAVMADVHELLNDDQEARLRGIMRRGPRGPEGRGMRSRRPGRPGDGEVGMAWRSGFREGWERGMRAGRGVERPDG